MNVLVIAPHADDEIIGCGGTIAKLASQGNDVYLCIVTDALPPVYDNSNVIKNGWPQCHYPETQSSNAVVGIKETIYLGYPTVMLETIPRYEFTSKLIEIVKRIRPEMVFLPHIGDMQKDHATVAEMAMVALRPKYDFAPKKIYAYETLSETGWNIPNIHNEFIPNMFVDISDFLDKKITAMNCYYTEVSEFPDARSVGAVESLARYRGALMNMKAAEAFMIIRELMK